MDSPQVKHLASWRDLLRSDLMVANILLGFMFMFLTSSYYLSFVYFSEYLQLSQTTSAIHVIYTAGPIGRFIGSLITSAVLDYYGALRLMEISGVLCGVFAFTLVMTSNVVYLWHGYFLMYLFLEICFCSLYSYAPELYPTSVRGTAIGVLAAIGDSSDIIFGLVGGLFVEEHPSGPMICAGTMMAAISFCALVLMYTHGEPNENNLVSDILTRDATTLSIAPSLPTNCSGGSNN
jgi:MFS family permease